MNTTGLPLIGSGGLDSPIAWRGTEPISRRQYLADVRAMSERLPANGPMLNVTGDRYRFAVGLGAVIALMVWLYWSSFAILAGAELNPELLKAAGAGKLEIKQKPPVVVKPRPAWTDEQGRPAA